MHRCGETNRYKFSANVHVLKEKIMTPYTAAIRALIW
jgi:hypothetical protein